MRAATRSLLWAAGLSPLAVIPASVPIAVWSAIESARESTISTSTLVWENLSALAVMSMFGIPTAYVAMLAIGVPAALLARRLNRTWLVAAIIVGGLCGIAIGLVIRGPDSDIRSLAIMLWYGSSVGAAFWLLFRRLEGRSQDVSSSRAA